MVSQESDTSFIAQKPLPKGLQSQLLSIAQKSSELDDAMTGRMEEITRMSTAVLLCCVTTCSLIAHIAESPECGCEVLPIITSIMGIISFQIARVASSEFNRAAQEKEALIAKTRLTLNHLLAANLTRREQFTQLGLRYEDL